MKALNFYNLRQDRDNAPSVDVQERSTSADHVICICVCNHPEHPHPASVTLSVARHVTYVLMGLIITPEESSNFVSNVVTHQF